MGRRRARCLRALGYEAIAPYDLLEDRRTALAGKDEYLMPLDRERRMLEWVLACEQSSRNGVHVTM